MRSASSFVRRSAARAANVLPALIAVLAAACAAPAASATRVTGAGDARGGGDGGADTTRPLPRPGDYREWAFLSSGFAMAYGPDAVQLAAGGVRALDNVFVPHAAREAFARTGAWPDGTTFVLEVRAAEGTGSIVEGGHFQTELVGLEAEVKDARLPGGWGFYVFPEDGGPARLLPRTAACYGCHAAHAAVENTFVQFYPTLFSVARERGTVRTDFVGVPPTAADLADLVAREGWSAGARRLGEVEARWPSANVLRDVSLNRAAYRLFAAGKRDDAAALLAEAVRRHPGSANTWDSLSEVEEALGRRDAARASVERGLGALAGDASMAPATRAALTQSLRARAARLAR